MAPTTIKLRAFFKEYNPDWKRCVMMFPDETRGVYEAFTIKFLTDKHIKSRDNEKTPINMDNQEFYIKCEATKVLCFLNDKVVDRIPVQDLIGSMVEIILVLKHYSGKYGNVYRSGWNLELKQMVGI